MRMWNNFFKPSKHFTRAVSGLLICGMILTLSPGATALAQTAEPVELAPDAIVDTGDAVAISDTVTTSNTNKIDTEGTATSTEQAAGQAANTASSTSSEGDTEIASSTEDSLVPTASSTPTTTPLHALDASSTATSTDAVASSTIASSNHATTTNNATTSANTGGNTAAGDGPSAIVTGDAYAYANVVNLTNTNIINSTGFIAFINQLFGAGTVDIRDMFDVFSDTSTGRCSSDGCDGASLEQYLLNNYSTTSSTVTVSANTGGNHASGSGAAIITGDAYAGANVTNVTNTNIIDANYLVLSFSNFGDLLGDIVLPNKSLLEKLFQYTSGVSALAYQADNQATIENHVTTATNTGGNVASSTASTSGGYIDTGSATTYTNVYNQVNTNVINDDSFVMLFRIHGDWNGSVFGLPDNLSWFATPGGIAITNTGGQTTPATRGISANIVNTANIENNVSVSASTGGNSTSGDSLSHIETGDAYATTNITNIANTNILGRNWSLLIFDIFGDWMGNLSFGQPDLWIGGTASAVGGNTGSGAAIEYTFTVSNLGDSAANNVVLNGVLDSSLIQLNTPLQNISLGTIEPGEMVELTYAARVTDTLPNGSFPINLTASITSAEPDENHANNEEVVTVIAENITRGHSNSNGFGANDITRNADIEITKTANKEIILPGDTVEYEVAITNHGGPVFNGILYDTLYDEADGIVLDQNWPLYTIDADETITVTYEITFDSEIGPGTYTNSAQVLGYHKNKKAQFMQEYDSEIATAPIKITGAQPQVLGISTSASCEPYLQDYLRAGANNDPTEVLKLQRFLQEQIDTSLVPTGHFDQATERAVRDFQRRHRATILIPWGITDPTGYVYYTTQKQINEIYCANTITFPLSTEQIAEIAHYRDSTASSAKPVANTAVPNSSPLPAGDVRVNNTVATKKPTVVTQRKMILLGDKINWSTQTTTIQYRSASLLPANMLGRFTNWLRNFGGSLSFWQ